MTRRRVLIAVSLAFAAAFVGATGFWLGRQQPAAAVDERAVLYWYDPMMPDTHFDKPGKSPFMDMDLVPRLAGEAQAQAGVAISPGMVQNLGIRLAAVERTSAGAEIRASGTLIYNDRSLATVQAKQDGFVDRGHGRAVGDVVRAGDPLIDMRVPAWSGALAEYLALRAGSETTLATAARLRLGALGVPADAITAAERRNLAPTTFTLRAPVAGALVALDARPGAALGAGEPIATISGLSPVWLVASVPQGSVGGVKAGASARATFPAFDGEAFTGRIDALLPGANLVNRTVEVRVTLDNRDGRLRPGMTGDVTLSGASREAAITVPSEAVIRTGRRSLVIVANEGGDFEPVEVTLGAAIGDRLQIVSGVSEGQRVVASGQFLIDSEANLTGVLERLRGSSSAALDVYSSTGRVTAIDASGVTLSHAPVPQLAWPEMTMAFGWGEVDRGIAVGDAVAFSFRKVGSSYELTALRKADAAR
jgi:Cu(I)/Ag(I) efflux system membrane fusion protein